MPKRQDLKTLLIIGAGPIVIGQACEFDYSGVQACKALKEEGYRIVLVNSNPATIMTDPEIAHVTYIEPLHWEVIAEIIAKEKPDALLPTMGGQTALNCALDLAREGVLARHNVELIGATREAIDKAEDREQFRQAMNKIGLAMPRSAIAHSLEEALEVQVQMGYPTVVRPSFTLGGTGGGIAYNKEEFITICKSGLELSPTRELLIDESIIGWKEYEMEVVRDKNDNCIIVCTIENLDPMGVHTGDSITVAPAQTLTDKEFQWMRNAAIAVLREIGVETGGSNVQFGVNPKTGELVVIEMNPRVSRSSALASKATGFPIAKVAAKLAVGYTLDELINEITGDKMVAAFEPTLDYVVTKLPRFNFDKFPQTDPHLTTQMKSVGEVMAIGRTFQESLQKALRGLEMGMDGLSPFLQATHDRKALLMAELQKPTASRLWYVADAFREGFSLTEVQTLTHIDAWFLAQIQELMVWEKHIQTWDIHHLDKMNFYQAKQKGFSDSQIADLMQIKETTVREKRWELGIHPVYKRIDTCAAEFPTETAYMYSTYEEECEAKPSTNQKIIVLGGGPNRIGQGIEFDYCCVHAALAMKELGYETIMINCNPETVSTDYDTSHRLYFESLTLEDVLEIVRVEKPKGVIVQYGGQTPLKLARSLQAMEVPIIGTNPDAIDCAEDRERFKGLIQQLGLMQPPNETARTVEEGIALAEQIGYPLVVRPSYVLGGRAMDIVYQGEELKRYLQEAVKVSNDTPILLDRFLDHSIEVDVDAICDGQSVFIGGIMEHIEQAGVHSGDSACCLPAFSLSPAIQSRIADYTRQLGFALNVVGLMNVQFAVQNESIYVLEVNPRASRTTPFVSKAIGLPLAKIAAKCMVGVTLAEQGIHKEVQLPYFCTKLPIFPFIRFPGVDPILGPEMKSTGEVMGIGSNFAQAYGKSQLAAQVGMPDTGLVFISVRDADKEKVIPIAKNLLNLNFKIIATGGTAQILQQQGVACERINKVREGRPHIVDKIKNDEISFIINTTEGKQAIADSYSIRRTALQHKVCYTTTIAGAIATIAAKCYKDRNNMVESLQVLYSQLD